MNAATASNYPDPFTEILQLRFPTDIRKSLQDQDLIQIYETFEFPKLQNSEIETISERISKGLSYNESMKGFSYLFPFRPSSLKVIESKCQQDGSKLAQFAVCFILHSYNAFCLVLEKNSSISYLPILLQSLNSIRDITPLAIKAFIRSVSYYSFVHDFYQLKLFLPHFTDFFKNANLNGFVAFDVFADLFTSLTKKGTTNISDEAVELYTLLSSIVEQNKNSIPQSAAIKIMDSIKFLVINMDFNALDLAAHISPVLGGDYVSELCKIVVPNFVDQITIENPSLIIEFPETPAVKLNKPEQIMEPIFAFQEVETFPNGFNVVSLERLPERDDISSLCKPEKVTDQIQLFLKIVYHHEKSAQTFLETFQDSIAISVKNRHFFDLMANFLNAALTLSEKVSIPHMVRFLFSDILFDPRLICTIEDTKSYKLNTLRSVAFELILNEGPTALESVMTESMPYPQLYSEIIYRCLIYRSLVGSLLLQSTKLLHIVVTSSLYYQKYCFMGKSDVDSVRLAIFLFFSFFFNMREIESYIFNDSYFLSSFLSFVFEEKVRPFILTQLKSYLTKDDQKVVPLLGEEIMVIFNIIQIDFPSTLAVNRLNDIFNAVIDSLSHQHHLAEMFKPVINPIMKSLPLLVNSKECQEFVLNTLQFFAVIAHNFTLSVKQLNLIESTILTVFGNNPSQNVFSGLNQIMNGDLTSSTTPTFIIRQPLVLPALLRIFINTPKCTEVIKYIYDLCTYTTTNAISCHTSGLDRLLLEYLHSSSYSKSDDNGIGTFDDKTIELILELFSKIAFLISSPDVVLLYLSLLSPIAGKGLPKHFDKVLIALNSIVSSSLKSPVTSIPFPKDVFRMEKSVDISEGFTFVAWIDIDSIDSHFKPYLFTLNNAASNEPSFIRISLNSNVIDIYQRTTKSESSARADGVLPLNHWSFISITYKILNANSQILVTINGRESRPLSFPIMSSSNDHGNESNDCYIMSFFGVADDSVDPDVPVLIGPFAVFPMLDVGTITQLFGHGPRQLNRMTISPFFTYVPQIITKSAVSTPTINAKSVFDTTTNENEDEDLKKDDSNDKNEIGSDSESESDADKNEETDENIDVTFINNPVSTTFLNVLINNCKVTTMIPLFSLIDFRNDSGKAFRNITDITIELISNSLLMSNETEIEFAQLHGFEILSELLMQTSFSHLTYSTYLRFFSLLQMLRTTELQTQLIRTIVGNIELWIVADAENQLRILKHWARVLFLSNSPTDNFSTFLSNTVLYYWDNTCDRDYLKGLPGSNRPRPSGLDSVRCRNYMIDVLLVMSQRKFTFEDFDLLMSFIKESPDEGTVLSLAHLVLMMARTVPSPLSVAIGLGDGDFDDKANESVTVRTSSTLKTFLFPSTSPLSSPRSPSSDNSPNVSELFSIEGSAESLDVISSNEIPLFNSKSATFSANSRFEAVKEKTEKFLALLHQLFKRNLPELTKILIEIICMLHVNKILTNPSFDIHIEIIIHRLSKSMLTQDLFEYLYLNLLPSIPQILPLCFWLAFNISDVAIAQLVTNTEPSEKFAISDRWAVWPIIIASQAINSVKASILVFLAKCGHQEWMNVYSTIIIVCNALKQDSSSMLSIFLTYLSNLLLCQMIPPNVENLESFFSLARHFLLFRDSKEKQRELETAFRFSPFAMTTNHVVKQLSLPIPQSEEATQEEDESSKKKKQKKASKLPPRSKSMIPSEASEMVSIRTMCDEDTMKRNFVKAKKFTNQIITFNELPKSYSFGLRLDERSRWKDMSLAQNTMHLVGITCYWPAFDIDLIICSFVMRTIPSIVSTHLQGMKISSRAIDQYQIYIDLLCFRALENKINCNLLKYKSKNFMTNASIALFETAKWKMEKFIEVPHMIYHSIREFYKEFHNVNPLIDLNVENEFNCYLTEMKKSLSIKANEVVLNRKLWNQLWNAITAPSSIWENAIDRKETILRDKIGCYSFCPFKTKTKIETENNSKSSIRPEFQVNCHLIVNTKEFECEFVLFNDRFEIVMNDNRKKIIKYIDIIEILPRSRFHQKNSIEVFLKDHKSYFISFIEDQYINDLIDTNFSLNIFIISKISQFEKRLLNPISSIEDLCEKWCNRKISNFEYIIELNKASGRSFNDLSQYPIFPWIIKDYNCQFIKLTETSLYRDLRRPIGTLNDERIKKLRENSEERKSLQTVQYQGMKLPYLYKSGPSSEKIVKEYISSLLSKSSTENDVFKSVPKMFQYVTSESEDFRELVPEFFFQPEVFNHIELPPWSHSPIEFVYLNRKALEGDYVSSNLDSWIDLIWGFLNKGREATKHENSFMPELYDNNEAENEIKIDFNLLKENGIIPKQLFTSKHPSRSQMKKPITSEALTVDAKTSTVAYASIQTVSNENKIVVTFIDASGILKKNVFTFGINNDVITIANVDTSIQNIQDFNFVSDTTKFVSISNDFILVSDESKESIPSIQSSENSKNKIESLMKSTLLLNTKTLTVKNFLNEPSICFAASHPYFATLSNELLIKVFNVDSLKKPSFTIPFYRVSATSMALSGRFHMIVVGGFEELLVYSISKTTLTKRIQLEEGATPLMVNISPSWGFIVVYATIEKTVFKKIEDDYKINRSNNSVDSVSIDNIENIKVSRNSSSSILLDNAVPVKEKVAMLSTFSVNGELIRKKILPGRIVALTSWKSASGFDFIAFATDKDKVYVCEAFFLEIEKGKSVMRCPSSIKELRYSEELQMLVVVTKDGSFFFKPYVPNESVLYLSPYVPRSPKS